METTTDKSFKDVPANKHAMAVMGVEGDVKTMWDASNADEVAEAHAQYDRLRAKGYRAFRVRGKDGSQGEQMNAFDPNAERIVFVPQMQGG